MTILCDLDGVIYRGGAAIPGVAGALRRLKAEEMAVYFITNNSTRTPHMTAEKIERVVGVPIEPETILTSGMAAMSMLGPDDSPVYVVGEDGLRLEVEKAGLEATRVPGEARAVVVGLDRNLSYATIADAMEAVRNGARFVATNDDTTYPTETGLSPGCGSIVAAIAAAADVAPEVAGKPNPPMRDMIRSRVGGEAWVIGDRVDTDIALANGEPGWRSVLVLTGITDHATASSSGADYVVADFSAAVDLVLDGR